MKVIFENNLSVEFGFKSTKLIKHNGEEFIIDPRLSIDETMTQIKEWIKNEN
jgi:hypothetical protein